MSEIANTRPLFTTTRRGGNALDPNDFCSLIRGYLQADAYAAYDSFFTNPTRGLIEVGCWAHARRHAYNARETEPARMGAVLAYIAQLYAVESAHARAESGARNCDTYVNRHPGRCSVTCMDIC
jgi:hypothetical protein